MRRAWHPEAHPSRLGSALEGQIVRAKPNPFGGTEILQVLGSERSQAAK
jgi:hypothetical protein